MSVSTEEAKELNARMVVLEQLVSSQGWQLFQRMCEQTAQSAYNAATNAATPHDMAKHMGALKVANDLASWPAREMDIIKMEFADKR